MSSMDKGVWRECQRVLNNPRMRLKDLHEWSTGEIVPQEGEIALQVDVYGTAIYVAVPASVDKRA